VRTIVCGITIAATLAGLAAAPAVATTPPAVVGSYTVTDLGQGGWAGGPLYADGTIGGGGGVAFTTPLGTEVWKVTGGTWSLGAGTVNLCLAGQPIHDPAGIFDLPFCLQIAPNQGPAVVDGTLIRVTLSR
jgi:hypothetical protein